MELHDLVGFLLGMGCTYWVMRHDFNDAAEYIDELEDHNLKLTAENETLRNILKIGDEDGS